MKSKVKDEARQEPEEAVKNLIEAFKVSIIRQFNEFVIKNDEILEN